MRSILTFNCQVKLQFFPSRSNQSNNKITKASLPQQRPNIIRHPFHLHGLRCIVNPSNPAFGVDQQHGFGVQKLGGILGQS
jgi:hypothetical protein